MKIMTENKCMTANQEENAVAEKNRKKVKIHVREMTFIAMMGAIGSILVFFRVPLPLLPPFLSFDVSPIIEMIGGFMYVKSNKGKKKADAPDPDADYFDSNDDEDYLADMDIEEESVSDAEDENPDEDTGEDDQDEMDEE